MLLSISGVMALPPFSSGSRALVVESVLASSHPEKSPPSNRQLAMSEKAWSLMFHAILGRG